MNFVLTADYHTHTIHSHGKGTVADNIEAAISCGLKRIAISDHGQAHMAYGIRSMDKYLKDIERCKEIYKNDIEVLSGIELNITSLDGKTDLPIEFADRIDIRILGYHKFVAYRGLPSLWHFYAGSRLVPNEKQLKKTTDAYIFAMQRGGITIISHPGYGLPVDIPRLAEACGKYGVLFEINSSHPGLRADDLTAAAQAGASFVVSSDAHISENVGRCGFALQKLKEAKLPVDKIVNLGIQEEEK